MSELGLNVTGLGQIMKGLSKLSNARTHSLSESRTRKNLTYHHLTVNRCFIESDAIIAVKPQNGALALSMSKKLLRNPCR